MDKKSIYIGDKVELEARNIEKLIFSNGKLTISEAPPKKDSTIHQFTWIWKMYNYSSLSNSQTNILISTGTALEEGLLTHMGLLVSANHDSILMKSMSNNYVEH